MDRKSLFCAKTRKLRNVARDTLRQLSLKNFTVQTFQNYGGGAPGENDKGLELNSNLEESEYEYHGPGQGYRIMKDELRLEGQDPTQPKV